MEEFGILSKVEVTGNLRVDEMGSLAQSLEAVVQKTQKILRAHGGI